MSKHEKVFARLFYFSLLLVNCITCKSRGLVKKFIVNSIRLLALPDRLKSTYILTYFMSKVYKVFCFVKFIILSKIQNKKRDIELSISRQQAPCFS